MSREPRNERQAFEHLRDAADEAEHLALWVRRNTPSTPAKAPGFWARVWGAL